MAARSGISVPIYKIDSDSALDFFGTGATLEQLPELIVNDYNSQKTIETYRKQGDATVGSAQVHLYRNITSRPSTSAWVKFFQPTGIDLGDIRSEMQHLACFVVVDDQLYAFTAGQSAVVFERFVDVGFPLDVGRRIVKPELKGTRSSQVTGSTLASDVHFRDPRRITYSESLQNVWTALSGQVREEVLSESALTAIFGTKSKLRVDVTSAIRLGPKVETLADIVGLVQWLALKSQAALPSDDGLASLDAIKLLSARKQKSLIARLRVALANKVVAQRQSENLELCHANVSLYDNATNYKVTWKSETLYEAELRPDLTAIIDALETPDAGEDPTSWLTNVVISSENSDLPAGNGTRGSLYDHLHGELRLDGKTYFLLAGKWYEVDAVYIEHITRDLVTLLASLNLDASQIAMRNWSEAESEGTYNETSIQAPIFINGDRVLTDNVELFDSLASHDDITYLVHVKRNFDVKMRDVRSQIINAAQVMENDLRVGDRAKLKQHHARLVARGRTTIGEADFLSLFEKKRIYVLAYGSPIKVEEATLDQFGSNVARMELVAVNEQFRQLVTTDSQAQLRFTWVQIA